MSSSSSTSAHRPSCRHRFDLTLNGHARASATDCKIHFVCCMQMEETQDVQNQQSREWFERELDLQTEIKDLKMQVGNR